MTSLASELKSTEKVPFPILTDMDNGYALSLGLAVWLGAARDDGGCAGSTQVPRQRSLDVAHPCYFRRRQRQIDKGPLPRSRFPNPDGDQRFCRGAAKLKKGAVDDTYQAIVRPPGVACG